MNFLTFLFTGKICVISLKFVRKNGGFYPHSRRDLTTCAGCLHMLRQEHRKQYFLTRFKNSLKDDDILVTHLKEIEKERLVLRLLGLG